MLFGFTYFVFLQLQLLMLQAADSGRQSADNGAYNFDCGSSAKDQCIKLGEQTKSPNNMKRQDWTNWCTLAYYFNCPQSSPPSFTFNCHAGAAKECKRLCDYYQVTDFANTTIYNSCANAGIYYNECLEGGA